MFYFQYLIEKCFANMRKLRITVFLQDIMWSATGKWFTIPFLK